MMETCVLLGNIGRIPVQKRQDLKWASKKQIKSLSPI